MGVLRLLGLVACGRIATLSCASAWAEPPGATLTMLGDLGFHVRDGIAGATCGTGITQNANPDVITPHSIACQAPTTAEIAFARSYQMAAAATLHCVDFAIASNNHVGPWPVRVRLYLDSDGGPPNVANLLQIGPGASVVIPANTTNQFFTATFPGVEIPADSTLVVELFTACRLTTPSDTCRPGGDGGQIVIGANNLGQSAPTYVKAPGCNLPDYVTAASIGFSNTHIIQVLGVADPDDCLTPLPPCSADIQPSGIVDIDDLLVIISSWGVTGPPRPDGDCAPLPNGDCYVDVLDLLAVLSQWGPCPAPAGACCNGVVCSQATQSDCIMGGGTYMGDLTQCTDVICGDLINDECVTATAITCGTTVVSGAMIAAGTVTPSDPVTSCELDGGGPFAKSSSLWYRVNTGGATSLKITTCNSPNPAVDMVMGVYDACGGNEIACGEDECTAPLFGLPATECLGATQDEYIILLQRYAYASNPTGDVHLTIDCRCTPPCGINPNYCECSRGISLNQTIEGQISGVVDPMPVCNGVNAGVADWYKIVGSDRIYTATTCASPFEQWDAAISVYCGACDSLLCGVASNSDSCGLHESLSWCAAEGFTYFIAVHSQSGSPQSGQGHYTLQVTASVNCQDGVCRGDSNNACQSALPISLGLTPFNTIGASTDGVPNAPGQCNDFGQNDTHHDIWYAFHATESGALTVTTCEQLGGSANYDTDIVIYSNSAPGGANCPPLDSARIACNDDDPDNLCGTAPPWASTAQAIVDAGQNYRIRVGGWGNGHQGTGVLNLTFTVPQCGNGVVEPDEQCDDANADCGDGCCNCVCKFVIPMDAIGEGEPCLGDGDVDVTNGGCNTTPSVYSTIEVGGAARDGLGSQYVFTATQYRRDSDWYHVNWPGGPLTLNGASNGLAPFTIGLVQGVQAIGAPCSGAAFVNGGVFTTTGVCADAVTVMLPPGNYAAYAALPLPGGVITYPCSAGPYEYWLRLTER